MNKRTIKTILISLSSLYIIIELFIEGFIKKIVYTANSPSKHIPFIVAIILLLIGILQPIDNNKKIKDIKKYKLKYMLLLSLGIVIFIGIISFNLILMLPVITIDNFISKLYFLSFFVWPLYIIGSTLIILSLRKILQLKNK